MLVLALCAWALAEPPYTNPFLGGDVEIADPYVLKWNGEYYLYCSGDPIRAFHSTDLVHWDELGPMLRSNPTGWNGMDIWAPEVVYRDGKFYMYYTGTVRSEDWKAQEANRRIGVAVADSPRGPFVDSGKPLTPGWGIDGTVFRDPATGVDYLFYSKLYEDGAGIAVDRFKSPTEVEGKPRFAIRGSEAWEDKDGDPANGTLRYTNEGPVVLEKDGRFYVIYSGGSWDMPTYALAYAVGSSMTALEKRPPILRGTRGVDGPGHNGVVKAPNNVDEEIIYHARVVPFVQPWNRYPFLDRLHWTGDRLYVAPPSLGGMPPPDRPLKAGRGEMSMPLPMSTYVLEVCFKLNLGGRVSIGPLEFSALQAPDKGGTPVTPDVFHEVTLTRNGDKVRVSVDGVAWPERETDDTVLRTRASNAEISYFALTDAFYDRSLGGWREVNDHPPTFSKHDVQSRYEFSANFLWTGNPGTVGIAALAPDKGLLAGVNHESWPFGRLLVQGPTRKWEAQLPRGFRYDQEHNLRMVRQDDLFTVFLDGHEMLAVRADLPPTSPAVYGQRTGFSQARYKRLVVEQNLLGNGGFEGESSEPWRLEGDALVNESEPNSGRRRLLLRGGQARQSVRLPAGKYRLEAYVHGSGRISSGSLGVNGSKPGWQRLSFDLSSDGAPLDILLSGPAGTAFDDVYLFRL